MTLTTSSARQREAFDVRSYLARYPLQGFFALAYAGAWPIFLPLALAQNGMGVLPFRLPLAPFLILGTFTGPALSAVAVAWAGQGKEGVVNLLRRYTIKPDRFWWYVLALFGPFEALLLGSVAALGFAPLQALRGEPAMFIEAYLGGIIAGLFVGPLGEELGWRGYALPRLQKAVGPLQGSLILGVAWAGWHLPLFLVPEWGGHPSLLTIAAFFGWVIPFTFVMTWIYNSSRGSLVIATLLHAAENAAVSLIPLHILLVPADLFLQLKVYGAVAVVLVVLTRGKLGVGSFREPEELEAQTGLGANLAAGKKRLTPGRIIGIVVMAAALLYVLVNIGYDIIHGPR